MEGNNEGVFLSIFFQPISKSWAIPITNTKTDCGVSVCVLPYAAVVCIGNVSCRNIMGFNSVKYGHMHILLLLLYLWVVANSHMCMAEYLLWKNKKKACHWELCGVDQAPQQWLSIRSALQSVRWCNSGTRSMLEHS